MTFNWTPEYSVRIAEIDAQHKKLFDLILKLEDCTRSPNFKAIVKDVLEDLMEYVNIHFETEEDYFRKAHYTDSKKHQAIHEEIKLNLNSKINDIFSRNVIALDVIGLHNFLTNWLKNHILEEDQQYVESLKKYHDL